MNFRQDGDEATLADPWSLFDEEDAKEALAMAEKCFKLASEVIQALMNPPEGNAKNA